MTEPPILIACIGNIFLGDDGFGVEVGRRLLERPQSPSVRVLDVGIRGLHFVYSLLEGYNGIIIVDTVQRGGASGTLYVIEPQPGPGAFVAIDSHDMDPASALRLAAAWGAPACPVRLIGCEPQSLEPGIGLSEPVRDAVERAVEIVRVQVDEIRKAGMATRG